MKSNNILFKGIVMSTALFAASCSDSYLNTEPSQFLDEDAVSEALQDPTKVQALITGAYMNFYNGGDYHTRHDDFGYPAIVITTDLLCEDVAYHRDQHFFCYDYQLDNRLGNYARTVSMWRQLYQVIDNTNDIIEMLKPTDSRPAPEGQLKSMLGQAYGLRAYCYFWLVNLWQQPLSVGANQLGVPLKTEDVYRPERVPVGEIYDQIVSDLENGYGYLKGAGLSNKGNLSEYSVAAIYANVLMFKGDYANAAKYAEEAIKGGALNSKAEMLSGFNSLDMSEVIWGYSVNGETTGYYASFFSHMDSYFIGYGGQVGFRKLVGSQLYDKIDANDVRKKWFGYNDDYNLLGISYGYEDGYGFSDYIAGKFRDKYMTSDGADDPFTSDIIYFRTAEMYYLAAEAYYLNDEPTKAQDKLNEIVSTRLDGYTCSLSGQALYDEICWQKRIDMWGEGCRYLDAKRRDENITRSASVNYAADLRFYNAIDYSARDYRMIYRIPTVEMQNNPEIPADDDNK